MSSCPRNINGIGRLMYKANDQPQFFKIILDDSFCQKKLGIPRKFLRNYGDKLLNSVILKVPSGEKWKVGIVKVNGQIWLDKGWQDFMEYYSIVIGSLVVFQYDETNSGFNVTIFDRTCTEIDYPYTSIDDAAAKPQLSKVVSDGIPVEISPSRKRHEKSPLSSFHPHKKMKKLENFNNITGKVTNAEAKKEHRISLEQMVKRKMKVKSKIIYKESSSILSQNPTFKIAIRPSHVHSSSVYQEIPAKFVRKYLKKKDGYALFNVLDSRTWTVKYCTYTHSGQTRTRLQCSYWKKFVQDNHLQIGDVCKFELIDPDKTTFGVIIFRSTTRASLASGSSSKQSMYKETSINILRPNTSSSYSTKAAKHFTSLNPFFQVVLTSWHLKSVGVSVPSSFINNMDQNETTQNVKLVVSGKMWHVKLLVYPNHCGNGKLCAGWALFARENCLKEGDVCAFELIDTRELLIKVSISRGSSTK